MSDEEIETRTRLVPLDELLLDPNNPRLIEDPAWPRVPDEWIPIPRVQRETAERLLGERAEKIRWLLQSLAELGWVEAEPIQVRELANGKLLVLDGNRRLVALRRAGEDRGSALVERIRVTCVAEPSHEKARLEHGARHIWGRHAWSDFTEAVWRGEINAWPREGDPVTSPEKRRSKLALDLCFRYQQSSWGSQFRSWMFSIFMRALDFHSLRDWLGFTAGRGADQRNLERFFSWISENGAHGGEPALKSFRDLLWLEELVKDPEALALIDTLGDVEAAWQVWARSEDAAPRLMTPAQAQKNLVELRRVIEAGGEEPVEATSEQPWPVLRAGASPSLASLRIAHFRGLSDVVLDGLTRINLLVGVNNAGKTSVLEAILLLCRLSDPRGLLETVRARVRMDPEALPGGGVARNIPAKASIASTLADGTDAGVEQVVSNEPSDADANIATFLTALRIEASSAGKKQISVTEFYTNRPRRTRMLGGERAWLAPAVFHSPFSLADRKLMSDCYARSYEAGTKDQVVELIRQHVDPDVEDIELVDTEGRFSVRHRKAGVLDLSSHGEGMQRIFQIGLLFAAHAHGIVLIDELENALHTSVLTSFSRMIQELAVRFDVQVFLTTHSDEALEAFLRNGYRIEDVTTFRLKREGDRVTVRRFDGPSHLDAVEAAGVDVRRL